MIKRGDRRATQDPFRCQRQRKNRRGYGRPRTPRGIEEVGRSSRLHADAIRRRAARPIELLGVLIAIRLDPPLGRRIHVAGISASSVAPPSCGQLNQFPPPFGMQH